MLFFGEASYLVVGVLLVVRSRIVVVRASRLVVSPRDSLALVMLSTRCLRKTIEGIVFEKSDDLVLVKLSPWPSIGVFVGVSIDPNAITSCPTSIKSGKMSPKFIVVRSVTSA